VEQQQSNPAQPPAAGSSGFDPTNVPDSNMSLALIGGVVAALIGAALWAVITLTTGYRIGFMAIGVGFLVGLTVGHLGKGTTAAYGILGAALSLAGCVVGNVLAFTGLIAQSEGLPYFATLSQLDVMAISTLLTGTFSPIDLLFYAIAVYEGFKLSFSTR
jgi:hypothetical protein